MQRLEYVLSRNLNSPLGKQDAFFETFVVPPEDFDKIPETKETDRIKYKFVLCKIGVEVFEKYEKEEAEPKEFKVFYEEDSVDKSNFFGTACRVKMSPEAKEFFIRISGKNQVVNYRGIVYDYLNLNGLNEFVKTLAKEKNINQTLLKGAIYLEIAEQSELNKSYKEIFSANNKLADWMKGGIEAIEKWKFTDKNYDYQKYYVDPMYSNLHNSGNPILFPKQEVKYKPIIPVPFPNPQYKAMSENKPDIVDEGLNKLSRLVDSFEEISTAIVYNIVRATPTVTDDIFFAVVFYVKNFIEDHMPESIKAVYQKLKVLFKEILNVAKNISSVIKEKVSREVAKMNAFLCGLINGLISLAQTIILLLAMVTDNIPMLEAEKTTVLELAKHQEKLEFIEDFVDLFSENAKALLEGVKDLFSNGKIWKEVSAFVDLVRNKYIQVRDLNEFFWAYFVGAVAFELILDAVIAYFTGGSSLVAEASAKISRLASKAEQLGAKGINIGKDLGKKVAATANDLIKWLRKEFKELLEAVKSGELTEWIKEKLRILFNDKDIDDVLNADYLSKWDDLPVSGKGYLGGTILKRRQVQEWIRKIKSISNGDSMLVILPKGHKLLQGNRAGFNPFNGNIYVQKGMTEYEICHESKHMEGFMKLGKDDYLRGMKNEKRNSILSSFFRSI